MDCKTRGEPAQWKAGPAARASNPDARATAPTRVRAQENQMSDKRTGKKPKSIRQATQAADTTAAPAATAAAGTKKRK